MADDLRALTRGEVVTLTAREWQLRERVSASHEFEQQRIGALGALAAGKGEVLVATVDALVQRTLPQSAMRDAMLSLKLGGEYDLDEVTAKLVAAGYVRCEQVEGVGQFARRGGILDVYPPLGAAIRCEFFDTELDSMGEFDVTSQRRVKNIKKAEILPAAEVLPHAAEGGEEAMLARMEHTAAQSEKKGNTALAETLRRDIARLRDGLPLGGADRYLAAAYPTAVTAADYIPADALVIVCEGARVLNRA